MPRVVYPKLSNSLKSRRVACEALGISRDVFWRLWHPVFTDPRDLQYRTAGVSRQVYEDELSVAVSAGGGHRGRLAVLSYRGKLGRS